MRDIETNISALVPSQFPSFYNQFGPDLIAFTQAYFEWLEQNHQLITVDDASGFSVGDSVIQDSTVGTIVYIDGNDMLVLCNGLEIFHSYDSGETTSAISNAAGFSTTIESAGVSGSMGVTYTARNIFKYLDIDTTLDVFITHFKEKYLKNIEFDTASNKKLMVKHSLDLYRSKGTQRSIDLFFRLLYGVDTTVYYPGQDLFKLSEGTWTIPQYLEISASSETRAVSFVGKQIKGVTSGASAFVEKYFKRHIKTGWVHVLYLTGVKGTFVNRELLITDKIQVDSPTVLGSLSSAEIVVGGKEFNIGDLVTFNSSSGDTGIGRVTGIADTTGVIDFTLLDGGYGYTDSANALYSTSDLEARTQSIVSEKVVVMANVVTTNGVGGFIINNPGTGYSNTDYVFVNSNYTNAHLTLQTDANGSILSWLTQNTGSGFTTNTVSYTILSNTGSVSSGTGANLTVTTTEMDKFFDYFEELDQPMYQIYYTSANSSAVPQGSAVVIANSTANIVTGTVITNQLSDSSNGVAMVYTPIKANIAGANVNIVLASDPTKYLTSVNVADFTATGAVMGLPNTATFTTSAFPATVVSGETVYQVSTANVVTGSATVTATATNQLTVNSISGTFSLNKMLRFQTANSTASLYGMQLNLGVYNVNNSFTNTYMSQAYSRATGTSGIVSILSSGSDASFKVSTITDTETIYLNTDLLHANNVSNVPFMDLKINIGAYGFPKNPMGNSSAILFSCLNYDEYTIGTIGSLGDLNPGTGYNYKPYVLAYQPYLAGFNRHDYVMTLANTSASFFVGEQINQANLILTEIGLTLDTVNGLQIGERVYQGANAATGVIVGITAGTNTISVNDTTGTFVTGSPVMSYIETGFSANTLDVETQSVVQTAKGIVKSAANTTTIYVKRTQFENHFVIGDTIQGKTSGVTATIVNVEEDLTTLPIGFNAQIEANVVTANGTATTLEISDSGLGYANGEVVTFTANDGSTGEAKLIVSGIGTGSGYYKTTKGQLSSTSMIQDGDYYQEYSYDIMSKIPLERYQEMFKKTMHTAGTRFFGSILLEEQLEIPLTVSNEFDQSEYALITFTPSNLDVTGCYVMANNTFSNGQKVTFSTTNGSVLGALANNGMYYVSNATGEQVGLVTNPRTISYTVDQSYVGNNEIVIARQNFVNGDIVTYTSNGYPVVGLTNGWQYIVRTTANGFSFVTFGDHNTIVPLSANTDDLTNATLSIAPIQFSWNNPTGTFYIND